MLGAPYSYMSTRYASTHAKLEIRSKYTWRGLVLDPNNINSTKMKLKLEKDRHKTLFPHQNAILETEVHPQFNINISFLCEKRIIESCQMVKRSPL